MNEKNNCTFSDRNSNINALANNLYSPKKVLFSDMCNATTDCELKEICNSSLYNDYSAFTSCDNGGYFVTKPDDNLNVYVLDSNLNEVDKIHLNVPNQNYNKNIEDIAYDPNYSKLFIAHSNKLFSVNNQGDFIKDEVNFSNFSNTSSGLRCCNTISNNTNSSANLNAINFQDNNLFASYTKNGSSFIAKVTSSGNLVNEHHIDDNIIPTHILNTTTGLHVIANKNDDYTYFYTLDKTNAVNNEEKCCHIVLNDECRIDICCTDIPCTLDGSLCEVIRSIALIEQGIAKIITSESEKIKNAVDNSTCTKELIDVNNSVSKTIMNLTMLEQMLKEKLELALTIQKNNNML